MGMFKMEKPRRFIHIYVLVVETTRFFHFKQSHSYFFLLLNKS